MSCDHEFKKTLDKSGMGFVHICHKCKDTAPPVMEFIVNGTISPGYFLRFQDDEEDEE